MSVLGPTRGGVYSLAECVRPFHRPVFGRTGKRRKDWASCLVCCMCLGPAGQAEDFGLLCGEHAPRGSQQRYRILRASTQAVCMLGTPSFFHSFFRSFFPFCPLCRKCDFAICVKMAPVWASLLFFFISAFSRFLSPSLGSAGCSRVVWSAPR